MEAQRVAGSPPVNELTAHNRQTLLPGGSVERLGFSEQLGNVAAAAESGRIRISSVKYGTGKTERIDCSNKNEQWAPPIEIPKHLSFGWKNSKYRAYALPAIPAILQPGLNGAQMQTTGGRPVWEVGPVESHRAKHKIC